MADMLTRFIVRGTGHAGVDGGREGEVGNIAIPILLRSQQRGSLCGSGRSILIVGPHDAQLDQLIDNKNLGGGVGEKSFFFFFFLLSRILG